MAACPQCGAAVGVSQRICRGCGANLDLPASDVGLIGRFFRRLFGGAPARTDGGRGRDSERLTVSTVVRDTVEGTDLDSLPPDVRAAIAKAREDAGALPGATVKTVGPLTVATHSERRVYRSLDEMPAEVRQRAQALLREGSARGSQTITVTIDGKARTYERLEDVPEPYREAIARARRRV